MDIRATKTLKGSGNGCWPRGRALRVLHITDTHLFADPNRTLLGVNTLNSLRRTLALSQQTSTPYDLVLATGDLVHDASAAGYRRLTSEISHLNAPVYCIPGNHDERIAMSRYLGNDTVMWGRTIDAGDWQILMLDSIIPSEEGGRLEDRELEFLQNSLATDRRPTLVCLHHHPQPVASAWIDTMVLENSDGFFEVIDQHPHAKAVLFGHIHQDYDQQRGDVRLLASPSSCVQFTPKSVDFQVDNKAPGYRLLKLLPDGRIQTQVVRCTEIPVGLEIASAGY
jgi:Icc protein